MNEVKVCCKNCVWFEERTKFCRQKPPVPLIMQKDNLQQIVSKYPVIVYPDNDWCSCFKQK